MMKDNMFIRGENVSLQRMAACAELLEQLVGAIEEVGPWRDVEIKLTGQSGERVVYTAEEEGGDE